MLYLFIVTFSEYYHDTRQQYKHENIYKKKDNVIYQISVFSIYGNGYLRVALYHLVILRQWTWYIGKYIYQVRVITVFTVFRLLTDFVCLYNYEFWLSLYKIVRNSVILLLPLFTNLFSIKFLYFFIISSLFLYQIPNFQESHILILKVIHWSVN
jgi:hypothetical protein